MHMCYRCLISVIAITLVRQRSNIYRPLLTHLRKVAECSDAQDRHKRAMELRSLTLSALSLLYLTSVAWADISYKDDFGFSQKEREDIQRTVVLGVGAIVGIVIASIAAVVLICVGCCCLCARLCRKETTVTNTVVMQPQGQPMAAAYPVNAYPQQVQPNPSTGMPPPAYEFKQQV
ncbi:protein shisa-5-like [Ornithodoros turicata]|uniref:protein shisa-5-like n=1 Tax=Ornithodoros turicata TaxID=34597 RepID=UPI003139A282